MTGASNFPSSNLNVGALYQVVTSTTRPPAPFAGMMIYEADTGRQYRYTGSAWRWVSSDNGEADVQVNFVPVGNTDQASGSYTDWITLTSALVVPVWASRARVSMTGTGISSVSGTWFGSFRVKIGSVTGQGTGEVLYGARTPFLSFTDTLTSVVAGTSSLILQGIRPTGSETLRADTACVFHASVSFLGA